jgi:hypothetical protein
VPGRFAESLAAALRDGKVLGIRAGPQPHRFIGIWFVVVEDRVFVRSWTLRPKGWYRTFLEHPRGAIQIADHQIPVRAVRTRSQRLKDEVDRAYLAKYKTPGSLKYSRGFALARRQATTTELVPAPPAKRPRARK